MDKVATEGIGLCRPAHLAVLTSPETSEEKWHRGIKSSTAACTMYVTEHMISEGLL